jgi:hypothetical protein
VTNIDDGVRRRWGKAGVRLGPKSREDAQAAQRRENLRYRAVLNDQQAREKWAAGLMVPSMITYALDAQGLYGPLVDKACGAKEPDVDMWEAGTLYPTWDQVMALSRLTDFAPIRFMQQCRPEAAWTTLRFHVSEFDDLDPVRCFTPEAVAAMKENR